MFLKLSKELLDLIKSEVGAIYGACSCICLHKDYHHMVKWKRRCARSLPFLCYCEVHLCNVFYQACFIDVAVHVKKR